MKKAKIENAIRKHQEELKILEETMENIIDGLFFIQTLWSHSRLFRLTYNLNEL